MYEVTCFSLETGATFTKQFSDFSKQKAFVNKCRYSQRIRVTGFTCLTQDEYSILMKYKK